MSSTAKRRRECVDVNGICTNQTNNNLVSDKNQDSKYKMDSNRDNLMNITSVNDDDDDCRSSSDISSRPDNVQVVVTEKTHHQINQQLDNHQLLSHNNKESDTIAVVDFVDDVPQLTNEKQQKTLIVDDIVLHNNTMQVTNSVQFSHDTLLLQDHSAQQKQRIDHVLTTVLAACDNYVQKLDPIRCTGNDDDDGSRIKRHSTDHIVQLALTVTRCEYELEMKRQSMVYDNYQRTIDRTVSNTQHLQTIAVQREINDWIDKLNTLRDKTIDTLTTTSFYCSLWCIGIVLINRILTLYTTIISYISNFNQQLTTPYHTKDSVDSYNNGLTSWSISTWYLLGIDITTTATSLYIYLSTFFNTMSLLGIIWAINSTLTILGLPKLVESTIKYLLFVTLLHHYELVSVVPIAILIILQVISYAVIYLYIWYKRNWFYKSFSQCMTNSNDDTKYNTSNCITSNNNNCSGVSAIQFNECINWFDQATTNIKLTHLLLTIVWIVSLFFSGYTVLA